MEVQNAQQTSGKQMLNVTVVIVLKTLKGLCFTPLPQPPQCQDNYEFWHSVDSPICWSETNGWESNWNRWPRPWASWPRSARSWWGPRTTETRCGGRSRSRRRSWSPRELPRELPGKILRWKKVLTHVFPTFLNEKWKRTLELSDYLKVIYQLFFHDDYKFPSRFLVSCFLFLFNSHLKESICKTYFLIIRYFSNLGCKLT